MKKTWTETLNDIAAKSDQLALAVFSKHKTKATLRLKPVVIGGERVFQASRREGNAESHFNFTHDALFERLSHWSDEYAQADVFTTSGSYLYMKSKRGKETVIVKPPKLEHKNSEAEPHDREKEYILPRGEKVDFLVAIGVMNKDGVVLAAKQRKFVQINRFLEIVEDVADKLPAGLVRIVDFGCGKAYLTFALYHYFTKIRKQPVEILGLDLKADVVEKCNRLAEKLGMTGLRFELGDIAGYTGEKRPDMMVSLHACDTATDAAIERAVRLEVPVILCVPCCQHEVNGKLENGLMEPLLRYGLLRERFSAMLTDALRGEILAIMGYTVTMIEFVDDSHTPKNVMIRAVKGGYVAPKERVEKYRTLVEAMNADIWLHRALFSPRVT